jgi:hypothetical protein
MEFEMGIIESEIINLNDAVNDFSNEMRKELFKKARNGKIGWDDERLLEHYKERLQDRVEKLIAGDIGQSVHIANQVMIIKKLDSLRNF